MPPEVMSMIFAISDRLTCAAACRVCHRWSGAAMDELWRSLPSLQPLFKLLGPLVKTDDGQDLHPECVLTERSWDLFRSYAVRVRSLSYVDDYYSNGISRGLIIRALAAHPGGILPNLRSVHWRIYEPGLSHPLAFCPPSLERMSLHLNDDEFLTDSAKRLLYGLSSSLAHHLKYFEFGTDSSSTDDASLSDALTTLLKGQSGLLELELSQYKIQDPVAVCEVCQASPHLRTFSANVLNVTKEMFRVILDALARRGTSLRRVWLTRTGGDLGNETICLADIEPMLQLTAIEDVRLWLDGKLELKAGDVRQMGQAWQGLTSLILCPDRGLGIPLRHLAAFAQWFPALQRFAARFDCPEDIPSVDEVQSRFKNLRRLTWLDAQIMDEQLPEVAEFLAVVLGPEVELRLNEYGLDAEEVLDDMLPWEAGYEDDELGDRIDAFYRVHKAIKRMG
ncbi:hypothetical protein FRC01_012926 [Tulasnella sp. 417]|nr:hypothetical protein FRC01_012926 [Tulasnella sp. 417]